MDISQIGEHGFIRRVQSKFPLKDQSVVLGIGDDAAIINPSRGKLLLFSTDTLREDIHFRKRYCTFYDIGWKAVAVSISDIAAMGGMPRYLLLSIAVPNKTSVRDLDKLLKGVSDVIAIYKVSLIGGNISRSEGGVTVDTTVIGELASRSALLRSGANVGDLIYVTGRIGNSSMGLALLRSSSKTHSIYRTTKTSAMHVHLHPKPRVREGVILGTNRLVTSMIDISDGLLADLGHICEQSRVGARIYSDHIPLPEIPDRLKKRLTKDPLFYALYGGEDYELLFTIKKRDKKRLETICRRERFDVTMIGEIVPRDKGIKIVEREGVERVIHPMGYDHFMDYRGKIC